MTNACARGWLFLIVGVCLAWATVDTVHAQDVFFTQSGGRGLQNAKMSARMGKAEAELVDVQAELAKVQPFAKEPMATCSDDGAKLRWNGSSWICDDEIDPTVQSFAKKALPSCGGGQLLTVNGGDFDCTTSGFVSNEIDPTVQAFAKAPLPSCSVGNVLSVGIDGNLKCVPDDPGLTTEADPFVHAFARTDVATIANCGSGFVLTMQGDRLTCVADVVGLTTENDPHVQNFARNDISGSVLAACASGEVLRADTVGGKVVLQCVAGASALAEALALNDLSDVDTSAAASNTVLMYQGGSWVAADELDPNVQGFARTSYTLNACGAGQVISFDGSVLSCVNDAGGSAAPLSLAGLSDVNVAGVSNGQFLKWDTATSKWVPGTVQTFAQTTLPTCASGSVLTGDGTALSCVADAGGASDPLALNDLSDVVLTSSANDEVMRFNGTNWVNSSDKIGTTTDTKWCYFSSTDIICDRDTPAPMPASACASNEYVFWNGSAWSCSDIASGVGNSLSLDDLNDVSITTVASGELLTWDGSGWVNQTPAVANVIAQGDSQVVVVDSGTGTVQVSTDGSAILTATGGQVGINTTSPNATLEVNGTVSATDLRLSGNLYVSGSQSIDGVVFANGGMSATGDVSATNFYGDGSGLTNVTASGVNWYNVANIPVGVQNISTTALDVAELAQLQNIGGSVLPASVWANLAYLNQPVSTTSTVTFANLNSSGYVNTGVLQASGYVSAGSIHTSGTVMVSDTLYTDALQTVGDGRIGNDLYVVGNFYVSGSQSIDGVIFANGGMQASGAVTADTVSATNVNGHYASFTTVTAGNFYGDGSGLTGVTATSTDRLVSGTTQVIANNSSGISFTTAGTERMTLDTSGNLTVKGFGKLQFTDSATSMKRDGTALTMDSHEDMRIYSDEDANGSGVFQVYNGAATGTTSGAALTVENGGNVGIGFDNPNAKLDVNGTISATDLRLSGNLYVSGSQSIDGVIFANGGMQASGAVTADTVSATNVNGHYASFTTVAAGSGSILNLGAGAIAANSVSSTLVSATNVSGTNVQVGAYSASCVAGIGGGIRYSSGALQVCDGTTWQALATTEDLNSGSDRIVSDTTSIVVNDGMDTISFTTAGTERMTVLANGRVGMGTTTPSTSLHILTQGNAYGHLMLGGGVNNAGKITFMNPSGSPQGYVGYSSLTSNEFNIVSNGGSGYLTFHAGGGERMRIATGGNVGIGTTSISATLDVSGTIKMAGTGSETCDASHYGMMRYNAATGGFQLCRP